MAIAAARVGTCPDPDRLLQAHAGQMREEDASPVLAHAAACPLCQTLVEVLVDPAMEGLDTAATRRLDARIASVTTGRPAAGRVLAFRRRWRAALAAAAVTAAAVLVVLVAPDTSIDLAGLPAASPPAATWRVPRLVVPVLRAERLDTSDMGLAALSWRGDAAGAPPWPAFDAACRAFDRGEFAEAERRLLAVTASTPALGDAWLLLGASRLLLGRGAEAIGPLARARDALRGAAQDDAAWHLAVALHGADRDTEARTLLGAMCASPSPRAPLACLAMDELARP
jgi:hypothetical protein